MLSLTVLCGLLVLTAVVGSLQWSASAQMAPHDGDAAAEKPEEGEDGPTLKELVQRRDAVQAVTARGQTIADAPPFQATPRIEEIYYYPCSDCHEEEFSDPRVRELEDEHTDLMFEHGGGRFWCYDACHNRENMDKLVSLHGEEIDYDRSYLLCGQCHFQRQKDWYFGGHGKRAGMYYLPREVPVRREDFDMSDRDSIGTWQGQRVIHNCTDCHDAHSPSIKPYEPSPPPGTRAGLARRKENDAIHVRIWDAILGDHGGE